MGEIIMNTGATKPEMKERTTPILKAMVASESKFNKQLIKF